MELEFVQSLANPRYLHCEPLAEQWIAPWTDLATSKYFDDPAFFHYLTYLEYWKKEPYVTYIRFPHCLLMLDLLHNEEFRKTIAQPDAKENLAIEQHAYYAHYLANRIKEAADQQPEQQTEGQQQQQHQQQQQQGTEDAGTGAAAAGKG